MTTFAPSMSTSGFGTTGTVLTATWSSGRSSGHLGAAAAVVGAPAHTVAAIAMASPAPSIRSRTAPPQPALGEPDEAERQEDADP